MNTAIATILSASLALLAPVSNPTVPAETNTENYAAVTETAAAPSNEFGNECEFSVLRGRSYDTFTMTLAPNELTYINVFGDGSTDLDLFVYDEFGNLIVSDERWGDDCSVWVHAETWRTLTIEIVNLGYISNAYSVCLD